MWVGDRLPDRCVWHRIFRRFCGLRDRSRVNKGHKGEGGYDSSVHDICVAECAVKDVFQCSRCFLS